MVVIAHPTFIQFYQLVNFNTSYDGLPNYYEIQVTLFNRQSKCIIASIHQRFKYFTTQNYRGVVLYNTLLMAYLFCLILHVCHIISIDQIQTLEPITIYLGIKCIHQCRQTLSCFTAVCKSSVIISVNIPTSPNLNTVLFTIKYFLPGNQY